MATAEIRYCWRKITSSLHDSLSVSAAGHVATPHSLRRHTNNSINQSMNRSVGWSVNQSIKSNLYSTSYK